MVPLSSSDDLPLSLLDRYLAGEATAAESAIVEVWIGNSVGRRGELESLRHAVTEPVAALAPGDVDAAVAGVLTASGLAGRVPRMGRPSSESGMKGQSYRLPRLWPGGAGGGRAWRVTAVVAAIVVALGAGLAVGVGAGVGRRRAGFGEAAGREYTTAAGQRLSVTLIDGTRLMLAPVSRVRVATDYGRPARSRDVTLEGEAYFAVVHDAAHPFAVHARGAVARDVGTAFDVRAYPEDVGARIAVAEGVVAVSTARGCRVGMGPTAGAPCGVETKTGDLATVGDRGVTVLHQADVAALTAWTTGRLTFEQTPLPDVLASLSRWYDLDLQLGESALRTHVVSGSFYNESPVEMLDAIAMLANARYERAGRRVTFTGNQDHR